jgi:hypothetical protein
MIRAAVIHQAANLHLTPAAACSIRSARSVRSGSQITSSIIMPGFVAPGIVAAFITGSR